MSAQARANGWTGFDGLGERVERSGFGHPPEMSGWEYSCDGMPTMRGCGETVVVTRRWTRVGVKRSGGGWLVCYGLEPRTPDTRFDDPDPDAWVDDHDVVLTYCPSCRAVVEGQNRRRRS